MRAARIAVLADLAQAAYWDFGAVQTTGLGRAQLSDSLGPEDKRDATWPVNRSETFAEECKVVAHQPDAAMSDFSATPSKGLIPRMESRGLLWHFEERLAGRTFKMNLEILRPRGAC